MTNLFCACHPLVSLIYFVVTLIFTLHFKEPFALFISLEVALILGVMTQGRKTFRFFAGLIPLFVLMSVLNPLLSHWGDTVLFTVFGKPYTWEALRYGMILALLLVTVLLWSVSYNGVMSSGKWLYLFAKASPSFAMVMVIIMGLVPQLRNRWLEIRDARKAAGFIQGEKRSLWWKIGEGFSEAGTLCQRVLEEAMVTADSMTFRGYGKQKRTSVRKFSFGVQDFCVLTAIILLTVAVCVCEKKQMAGWRNGALAALFHIPVILNLWGTVKWQCLLTRIKA